MPNVYVVLVLVLLIICVFLAGVLLALGFTGGSLRCIIRGHERSSQIWTSRDSAGEGYSCPRCGVLWLPSNPSTNSSPETIRSHPVRSRLIGLSLALAILCAGPLAGCTSSDPVRATVRIGLTAAEFQVEVAQTADQQRDGLSDRDQLASGTGMLFRFGSRSEQQVWMAGMKIPLDVAWIADGKVVAVDTLSPCAEADQNTCPRWTSPSPVDALLEVSAHALSTVVPGMAVAVEELPR